MQYRKSHWVGLLALGLGALGCGQEPGEAQGPGGAEDDLVHRAGLHYGSYEALAARAGYAVYTRIVGAVPMDPKSPTLEDSIITNIDAADEVIPYVAGLGEGGYWWLQTELVSANRVVATGEDLDEHAKILGRSVGLEYEQVYALDMELMVGEELVEYTAYAFYDRERNEVDIIDPVALGVGSVPEHLPRHSQVGESKHDTWTGCKPFHQQQMPQGEMEHWDLWCWDKAKCNDEAVGKIFCNPTADGCPRIHGTTVQSGSCKNTAGGGILCTGPGASSVNSKETTLVKDNCQDNINVELWWGPTSTITWEIEAKIGGVIGIKFGGQTPSHSVYQVYKLTMCCVGVAEPEPGTSTGTGTDSDSDSSTGTESDTDGDADSDSGSTTSAGESVGHEVPDLEPIE